MKTNLKWRLIPVGIGLVTFAAFVGSLSGSLAWWAYSTRVSVSYQGTSVTTSAQLQIGLKTTGFGSGQAAALTGVGLTEDVNLATIEGGKAIRYFFADAGIGLPANAISTYLTQEGSYATTELCPVTSRTYTTGGAFNLYNTLIAGNKVNTNPATKDKYVAIPFVFRIVKPTSGLVKEYVADQDIWLSDTDVEASSTNADSQVHKAIRAYFSSSTVATSFILNPSDEGDVDGSTVVAGCLDLNRDAIYDYDETGKEIVYGDYTGTGTNTFVQNAGADSGLENINGVVFDGVIAKSTENSTFYAKHGRGKTCYADYTGITLGTAQYKTLQTIAPNDVNGRLSGGTPLCRTADDANALADLNVTIWLEGWDHTVIDEELSHSFNLGLQFQINLVS